MNVIVRCLTADGLILGSESVQLDVKEGRGFPMSPVIVTISAPGRVALLEAYVPLLDRTVPLRNQSGEFYVDKGHTVTLDFDGPLLGVQPC